MGQSVSVVLSAVAPPVSVHQPSVTDSTPSGLAGIDGTWMHAVSACARATAWLHAPLSGYASYGVALFALLLVVGWWTARNSGDRVRVARALWAGAGTLVADGINQPIVNAVHEPRPYTTLPHLFVLAARSSDFSFPSDHATMAGAVAAGLFLVSAPLG